VFVVAFDSSLVGLISGGIPGVGSSAAIVINIT
jgi:hypothetical protein